MGVLGIIDCHAGLDSLYRSVAFLALSASIGAASEKSCKIPAKPAEPVPFSHAYNFSQNLQQIKAGEGGRDSELFCRDLMRLYHKFSASRGLACSTEREKEGDILLRVEGENALNAFSRESGKNVVQRVPQTEKAGRRQTSLVSVAVLPLPESERFEVLDSEIEIFTKRGSGPGGQHRNKTESCVVARHIPTGVEVKIDGRKQGQNRIVAVQELSKRVRSVLESARKRNYDELRSSQMGCQSGEAGGRGEKIRTYNFIDSRCVDHRSGKLTRDLKSIMNGSLELVL